MVLNKQTNARGNARAQTQSAAATEDLASYDDAVGVNPLVWAASRLLDILSEIQNVPQLGDVSKLRRQLVMEVRTFEQRARSVGVPGDELVSARYCLCTAIDEIVSYRPWGANDVWTKQNLLVTFHQETHGGEKYYRILNEITQNPERYRNLIELLYYCIALGFEGYFKVAENGHSRLETLKQRIAAILKKTKGAYAHRLSPHWQGVNSTPPFWRLVSPWVVAALCALVCFGVYLLFLFSLSRHSDETYARLAALRIPEPALPVVSMPPTAAATLKRFLAREIDEGLVEVAQRADRCVVTLTGDGLFESGSIDIRSRYWAVLQRIADALREVDGNVIVSGYTDNVPMRSSRFPSNWELSQARADSTKRLLDGYLGQMNRIRAEGRGEADPLASNATPEGRARNRRVEIAVLSSAEAIHSQLNPSEPGQ